MPRTARASVGNVVYHAINRGNGQANVFHKPGDYVAFLKLLREASDRLPVRLLGFCLMPNHFHLVLWPRRDGDLSKWMQWLLTAHVRRYHRHYRSSGHVWQGRFKAFPVQQDEHLLTVLRYVERNPVRVKLARTVERYRWSSASINCPADDIPQIHRGPVSRGDAWLARANCPIPAEELAAVRHSVARGTPFGNPRWQKRTAERLGLESSLRPRGRPRRRPR